MQSAIAGHRWEDDDYARVARQMADESPELRDELTRRLHRDPPPSLLSLVVERYQQRKLSERSKKSGEAVIGDLIDFGLRLLQKASYPFVWMGVSHNAWIDRQNDIIPLSLIVEDIEHQTELIKAGKTKQYGFGLWQDHQRNQVIGDCAMRVVIEGGRSCFEMGNQFGSEALPKATMSIGYRALMDQDDEYKAVFVYERSRLQQTIPVNARTFWSAKHRMPDAQIAIAAQEMIA